MNWRYLWASILEPFYRIYLFFAWRYCQKHGHKWGRSGTSFDGEYTCHWTECDRCGYADSD